MNFPLDHFCRYDELTSFLEELAASHPHLVALDSIGRSHEGRELWLVTVSDSTTGAHSDKPAMWVDANIHATELTAGVAAIGLLRRLVTGHTNDETVRAALATRTFYVMPRVNPDGAELALADQPTFLRSGVRPWPWTDRWAQPGLHRGDLDGDGLILSMRVEDPTGAWTTHPDDERLMIAVPPEGSPAGARLRRYRMLDEGRIDDFDGYTIPTPRPVQGLDFNRNFASGWGTSVPGSGDFPGSEPEIHALMKAMTDRPNICGANAYHTSGGVLLRPSSSLADSALPPNDVWMFKTLGARCTELTTYPVHSTFEDFTWDRSDTMSGAADDWAYEHLGVFAWTTEFWDAIHAATGERSPTSIWYLTVEPEVELAVLRWFDRHHPGHYHDWVPFDHPQLGSVEIGGWDSLRTWINPPAAALEAEVAPHADFAIFQALASPRLEIERVEVTAVGDETWRVDVGIANTGYLPTTVTRWAAMHQLVRPVVAELELGAGTGTGTAHTVDGPGRGVAIVGGGANRQTLGQLAGYSQARFADHNDGTPNRALASWLVTGSDGSTIEVVARHQRAGVARATITLDH